MTVKIYVDQLLMINFAVNWLLLVLLKRFIGFPARKFRLVCGALAGSIVFGAAVFGTVFIIQILEINEKRAEWIWIFLLRGICAVLGGSLMIITVWGKMNRRAFLRAMGGLLFVAVLFGGLVYGILSFLPKEPLSTGVLMCAAGGGLYLARAAILFISENREKKQKLYPAVLNYQGEECRIMALWDTGNQLTDLLTKKPVHILDRQAAERIVKTVRQVRYIPYQSIGQPKGVLPAIFFDEIRIEAEKETVCLEKPLVGLASHAVSPKGEYQLLLNGSSFEKNQQQEKRRIL